MNSIYKINAINQKELENNVSDEASWHADYSDTSYIYIGNLHEAIEEKDLVTIFSQWGNPTHVNLIKDRESGKLRGFAYLKYEDQRSCVLAVDNFNGVLIYEKPLKVDHTYFQLREGQEEEDFAVDYSEVMKEQPKIEAPKKRKTERKEIEAAKDLPSTSSVFVADDDDFNDPMADMLKRTFEEKDDKEHNSKHRNKKRKSRSREDQKTEDAKGAA
uniref:RRM domain-containing protein n=1 Tax=Candidozyma auris TaxID=498019 RepID=A0A0L0P554_CANAR